MRNICLAFYVALVTFHSTSALEVGIKYISPVLRLTLPLTDKDVGAVLFHYTINNEIARGKGVFMSSGWELRVRIDSLAHNDVVTAYADVYNKDGSLRKVTSKTSFTHGDSHAVAALPPERMKRAVTFRDDFNSINTGNWHYESSMYGGYNGEFQVYLKDSQVVFVRDGKLWIKPMPTVNDARFTESSLHSGTMDMNNLSGFCTISDLNGCHRQAPRDGMLPPVMSGKLFSAPGMTYGTVEVRARIPKGDWIWPAIWMMPQKSVYGGWPRSGEIDIMESRGNAGDYGVGTVTSTLHWGPSPGENKYSLTHGEKKMGDWSNDFHTWKVERSADHLTTYVDNQVIMDIRATESFWSRGGFGGNNIWASGNRMAPFDQEFYLILNVAVGGTGGFFWQNPKPWSDSASNANEQFWNAHGDWLPTWQGDKVAMEIDYVEFRT